jgi:hypothetical protein
LPRRSSAVGREGWAGDQLADRVTRDITIRYQPGLSTVYRVMWRSEYLDVRAVTNVDARDMWLTLACERRQRAGSEPGDYRQDHGRGRPQKNVDFLRVAFRIG